MNVYINKNARIASDIILEDGCQILGPSIIESGCIIGSNVIIGHPSKKALLEKRNLKNSNGVKIGKNSIIRSGTVIYENAEILQRFQCGHNSIIREGVRIGENSAIGNSCVIEWETQIGDNARFQNCITAGEKILIGNNVFVGPNVSLTTGRHMASALVAAGKLTYEQFLEMEKKYLSGPGLIIKDNVRIGANAVIIAGVTLEENSMVAAGAVVSMNVPAAYIAVGNPARIFLQSKP